MGNSLCFLSRLWWFDGNRRQAERFAREAVDVLADQPQSRPKAMAFSNMSQLKMLSDQTVECIHWGEKAISIANELKDEEILSHAYNNVGTVQMRVPAYRQKGLDLLKRSLDIALKGHLHEHAARAYTNMASNAIQLKDYPLATKILFEGIHYCEEVELNSWRTYMLSWKARLLLDTGRWAEAQAIAEQLIGNETQASIVKILALVVMGTIRMRTGEADALPLLKEARTKAFESMELQRMLPALTALLEYEWITGQAILEKAAIEYAIGLLSQGGTLKKAANSTSGCGRSEDSRYPCMRQTSAIVVKPLTWQWRAPQGGVFWSALMNKPCSSSKGTRKPRERPSPSSTGSAPSLSMKR